MNGHRAVVPISVTWLSRDDQRFQALLRPERGYSYVNPNLHENKHTSAFSSNFKKKKNTVLDVLLVVVCWERERGRFEERLMNLRSSLKR